jgi:hypothetical protein
MDHACHVAIPNADLTPESTLLDIGHHRHSRTPPQPLRFDSVSASLSLYIVEALAFGLP